MKLHFGNNPLLTSNQREKQAIVDNMTLEDFKAFEKNALRDLREEYLPSLNELRARGTDWDKVYCPLRRPLTKFEIDNNLDFRVREELSMSVKKRLAVQTGGKVQDAYKKDKLTPHWREVFSG